MSNEAPSKRLLARPSPAPPEPAPAANADVEQMLTALEWMEAATQGEPNAINHLRDLGELAKVVADVRLAVEAKGALDQQLRALLQDLEGRIQNMTALAGPHSNARVADRPSAEPEARSSEEQAFLDALGVDAGAEPPTAKKPAEPAHVPTVSDVFSQLGRAGEGAVEPSETAHPSSGEITTVAMLEAMVENLAASMSAAQPEPRAAPPAQEAEITLPETKPLVEDSASLPEPAGSGRPIMPELELLSNFARTEAVPYLPPEIGTAVIFEAKAGREAAAGGTARETTHAAGDAQPDVAAGQPSALSALGEPMVIMPPIDVEDATDTNTVVAEQNLSEPSSEPPMETGPSDLDLEALLFEPQPQAEPDPAAFLLEPDPWPRPVSRSAQSTPPEAASVEPPTAAAAAPATRTQKLATAAAAAPPASWQLDMPAPAAISNREPPAPAARPPHDPLAPLKAMSDEEKIALFE